MRTRIVLVMWILFAVVSLGTLPTTVKSQEVLPGGWELTITSVEEDDDIYESNDDVSAGICAYADDNSLSMYAYVYVTDYWAQGNPTEAAGHSHPQGSTTYTWTWEGTGPSLSGYLHWTHSTSGGSQGSGDVNSDSASTIASEVEVAFATDSCGSVFIGTTGGAQSGECGGNIFSEGCCCGSCYEEHQNDDLNVSVDTDDIGIGRFECEMSESWDTMHNTRWISSGTEEFSVTFHAGVKVTAGHTSENGGLNESVYGYGAMQASIDAWFNVGEY
jgi:hypothetical protein